LECTVGTEDELEEKTGQDCPTGIEKMSPFGPMQSMCVGPVLEECELEDETLLETDELVAPHVHESTTHLPFVQLMFVVHWPPLAAPSQQTGGR